MKHDEPSNSRARPVLALLCVAALALAVTVALPPVGHGQAGIPTQLAGHWRHDGDVSRGVSTVDRAFAASIARFPELFQGIARNRIRTDLAPPRTIDVTVEGTRVHVVLRTDETKSIEGALSAHATTHGVDDGTVVTPRLQGGWLELFYEGESSEMRQLFSTEPDGAHLHLDYTIVNERLGGAVRYRLEYVRG